MASESETIAVPSLAADTTAVVMVSRERTGACEGATVVEPTGAGVVPTGAEVVPTGAEVVATGVVVVTTGAGAVVPGAAPEDSFSTGVDVGETVVAIVGIAAVVLGVDDGGGEDTEFFGVGASDDDVTGVTLGDDSASSLSMVTSIASKMPSSMLFMSSVTLSKFAFTYRTNASG